MRRCFREGSMLGLELVGVGVVVFFFNKKYQTGSKFCARGVDSIQFGEDLAPDGDVVKRKLLELSQERSAEEDEELDEEEIFGSGVWGVDFHSIRYAEEPVLGVALYEETIKPRTVFPIIHPYVLVETPSWVYVFEKWRDGVAVSRFKSKEQAIRSRGKWFGPGRLSQRRAPHLIQSTNDVQMSTTDLLVWTIQHPYFKQYTDNCHTFAANLCKKSGLQNPNSTFEDIMYESY